MNLFAHLPWFYICGDNPKIGNTHTCIHCVYNIQPISCDTYGTEIPIRIKQSFVTARVYETTDATRPSTGVRRYLSHMFLSYMHEMCYHTQQINDFKFKKHLYEYLYRDVLYRIGCGYRITNIKQISCYKRRDNCRVC